MSGTVATLIFAPMAPCAAFIVYLVMRRQDTHRRAQEFADAVEFNMRVRSAGR